MWCVWGGGLGSVQICSIFIGDTVKIGSQGPCYILAVCSPELRALKKVSLLPSGVGLLEMATVPSPVHQTAHNENQRILSVDRRGNLGAKTGGRVRGPKPLSSTNRLSDIYMIRQVPCNAICIVYNVT